MWGQANPSRGGAGSPIGTNGIVKGTNEEPIHSRNMKLLPFNVQDKQTTTIECFNPTPRNKFKLPQPLTQKSGFVFEIIVLTASADAEIHSVTRSCVCPQF